MPDMTKTIRNLPIRWKLRIIMVSAGVALLFSWVAFLRISWLSLRDFMQQDCIVMAEAIGSNCTAALLFNDSESSTEILSALGKDTRVMDNHIKTVHKIARFLL